MFKALADADRRYAGAIKEHLTRDGGNPQGLRAMLTTLPLAAKVDYTPNVDTLSAIAERVTTGGIKSLNAGYRYGLPAAGVTLAGKALLDLTGAYETQTNGTIMP